MAILNTAGMQRKPTHPGEMLREDFLPDYGLTVSGLAESLGVSRQSVNELLRERRAVSPEMAEHLPNHRLADFRAALDGMVAINQYFRLNDRHDTQGLADRRIAGENLGIRLDRLP